MSSSTQKPYKWAVIGAGPAGIAAIGKLLDHGFSRDELLWIDPFFQVGDLGSLWKNVSSNTTVKLFIAFLKAIASFRYEQAPMTFALNTLPLEETCTLQHVVTPLQWVSDQLQHQVTTMSTTVQSLTLIDRIWSLTTEHATAYAENIILATGATPTCPPTSDIPSIPLDVALDKSELAKQFHHNETYAVFGSSHSAMIVLRHLIELGAKNVINFYRSPCRYALDMGDWILFDNTGLKGETAMWTRQHIDGTLPKNLTRHVSDDKTLAQYLPLCDKAIYAIGFQRRTNIVINGTTELQHNPQTGIIAPGLFGFGIAYPERTTDPLGHQETSVGLWKFMKYIHRVFPIWLRYHA